MKYYNKEIDEVLKELSSDEDGLSEQNAKELLIKNGRNELPKPKQDSVIKLFFDQFKNPIELILVVTVILSFVSSLYFLFIFYILFC